MAGVARKVCMSVGNDAIGCADGAGRILCILRERFAPDAIDGVSQDVVTSMYIKRTDQN